MKYKFLQQGELARAVHCSQILTKTITRSVPAAARRQYFSSALASHTADNNIATNNNNSSDNNDCVSNDGKGKGMFQPTNIWSDPQRTVSLFGAPLAHGQPLVGTESAPSILRTDSLLEDIKARWRLHDHGDIDLFANLNEEKRMKYANTPGARNCVEVGQACQNIYTAMKRQCDEDHFILTLVNHYNLD